MTKDNYGCYTDRKDARHFPRYDQIDKEELIERYYMDIKEAIKDCTEESIRARGKIKYSIWCWVRDGVEIVEAERGNGDRLLPKRRNGQQVVHIVDIGNAGLYLDDADTLDDYDLAINHEQSITEYIDSIDWDERMEEILGNIYFEGVDD
jgi:hypothetical protein